MRITLKQNYWHHLYHKRIFHICFKCIRKNKIPIQIIVLLLECLDVMITSLDQAPLEKMHIPALFYLAETTLYWLRTEAIHQPYLRTGEIKLLRMGQIVFMRLFFHHMSGHLQGHEEFKNRLFTYLDGMFKELSLLIILSQIKIFVFQNQSIICSYLPTLFFWISK